MGHSAHSYYTYYRTYNNIMWLSFWFLHRWRQLKTINEWFYHSSCCSNSSRHPWEQWGVVWWGCEAVIVHRYLCECEWGRGSVQWCCEGCEQTVCGWNISCCEGVCACIGLKPLILCFLSHFVAESTFSVNNDGTKKFQVSAMSCDIERCIYTHTYTLTHTHSQHHFAKLIGSDRIHLHPTSPALGHFVSRITPHSSIIQ